MKTDKYPHNIWLIDDDRLTSQVNKRLLELCHFGQNIYMFHSPIAALEYMKAHIEEQEKLPDLIFLDILMPKMDGRSFIEHSGSFPEKVRKKCRIVFLSSCELEEDFPKINNQMVIRFLSKPLTQEHIELLKNTWKQT